MCYKKVKFKIGCQFFWSTNFPFLLILMLAVFPPSSGALLRYFGYPSLPCSVNFRSYLGKRLLHLPSLVQTQFLLKTTHGLCTIFLNMMWCSSTSLFWSGISAKMMSSIWFGLILLSLQSHSRMWA